MNKTCAKCGRELAFRRNARGRWEPCNPDGSDHWDLCRQIRYARAMKGERIETIDETYYVSPKEKSGTFTVRKSYGIGKKTKDALPKVCGRCDVPPWESCECTGQ